MAKILYVENGQANDQAARLLGPHISTCCVSALRSRNLMMYDVLLIPSYSNEDLLLINWPRIERFLKYGGWVVALCGVQGKSKWLPFCKPHPNFAKRVGFKNATTPEGRAIFDGLALDGSSVTYHQGFVSHGGFRSDPDRSLPLLIDSDTGEWVLAVLSPAGLAGRLLVTTLDPDYHAVVGRTLEQVNWNPNAQKLFHNLISWAENGSDTCGRPAKLVRRLMGISSVLMSYSALLVASGVTLLSVVGLATGILGVSTVSVVGSIASLVSLSITLHLLLAERR